MVDPEPLAGLRVAQKEGVAVLNRVTEGLPQPRLEVVQLDPLGQRLGQQAGFRLRHLAVVVDQERLFRLLFRLRAEIRDGVERDGHVAVAVHVVELPVALDAVRVTRVDLRQVAAELRRRAAGPAHAVVGRQLLLLGGGRNNAEVAFPRH